MSEEEKKKTETAIENLYSLLSSRLDAAEASIAENTKHLNLLNREMDSFGTSIDLIGNDVDLLKNQINDVLAAMAKAQFDAHALAETIQAMFTKTIQARPKASVQEPPAEARPQPEQAYHIRQPGAAPTDAQIRYIKGLGGIVTEDMTRQEASDLIEELKKKRPRRGRRY